MRRSAPFLVTVTSIPCDPPNNPTLLRELNYRDGLLINRKPGSGRTDNATEGHTEYLSTPIVFTCETREYCRSATNKGTQQACIQVCVHRTASLVLLYSLSRGRGNAQRLINQERSDHNR